MKNPVEEYLKDMKRADYMVWIAIIIFMLHPLIYYFFTEGIKGILK